MKKMIFFTGAGVSAESGISTFRDSNGLWENHKIEEVCNINTWKENKEAVFRFYSERRKQLKDVEPNDIHKRIAELQIKYGVENIKIITQNVDDLFERAGALEVLHLHGNLSKIKCTACKDEFDIGYTEYKEYTCSKCGEEALKPSIIFFGEEALNYHFMKREFRNIDDGIFVVMGTMGNVVPIQTHIQFSEASVKILNNLEESPYINDSIFHSVFYGPGTKAIKPIMNIIEKEINR